MVPYNLSQGLENPHSTLQSHRLLLSSNSGSIIRRENVLFLMKNCPLENHVFVRLYWLWLILPCNVITCRSCDTGVNSLVIPLQDVGKLLQQTSDIKVQLEVKYLKRGSVMPELAWESSWFKVFFSIRVIQWFQCAHKQERCKQTLLIDYSADFLSRCQFAKMWTRSHKSVPSISSSSHLPKPLKFETYHLKT